MDASPLANQPRGTRWEIAFEDIEPLDGDRGSILTVLDVKVGRRMLPSQVHAHNQTIEPTDLRHSSVLRRWGVNEDRPIILER
jgi:hypothetical protein